MGRGSSTELAAGLKPRQLSDATVLFALKSAERSLSGQLDWVGKLLDMNEKDPGWSKVLDGALEQVDVRKKYISELSAEVGENRVDEGVNDSRWNLLYSYEALALKSWRHDRSEEAQQMDNEASALRAELDPLKEKVGAEHTDRLQELIEKDIDLAESFANAAREIQVEALQRGVDAPSFVLADKLGEITSNAGHDDCAYADFRLIANELLAA